MKNILVPTDFSTTAQNATLYALELAAQLGAAKIVLYNSYEIPVTIDPMVPGVQMLDIESIKEGSEKSLENEKYKLSSLNRSIEIETISEYGALTTGLDSICEKAGADLIVMGITGGGLLSEKLIGSNTISVAKHTRIPVIIVPADAKFTKVSQVMLLSDFDHADETIPIVPVRKLLAETKGKLFVFNLEEVPDQYGVMYPSNMMGESYAMHTLLKDLNPEYHFSHKKNYIEAVNEFAHEHAIDLIITIPKKHSFIESFFKSSHTKMLAFHSHVPLMVVHG